MRELRRALAKRRKSRRGEDRKSDGTKDVLIHDEIKNDFQSTIMTTFNQIIHVLIRSILRITSLIITDIVSLINDQKASRVT